MNYSQNTDTVNGGSSSTVITQQMYLRPDSFGTLNRKFMYRVGVRYSNTDSSTQTTVSYSDDLMRTFSTPRTLLGISTGSSYTDGGFPFLTQLGSFRQRGFLISGAGEQTLWYNMEADINKGQQ